MANKFIPNINIKSIIVPPILFRDLVIRLWKRSKELKKEEEMVKGVDSLMHAERSDDSESADIVSGDVEKTIQEARLDLIQSARLEIRKALAKVKIGTYGMCESCKKPIYLARLKVFPQATMCFECAKKLNNEK
ncbi:MAG: TraR/DksA family transcriptional regulator [Patescibacteria group bacterium]